MARPWWQERSLTGALLDIPGVDSVESTTKDRVLDDHPYRLRFADDVTAAQLVSGVPAVKSALDDHQIAGDHAGVEMSVNGFTLVSPERYPISDEVLEAIVALRDVKGLAGVDAREGGRRSGCRRTAT